VKRVKDAWNTLGKLHFDLKVVIAGDEERVAIVYDSTITTKDGTETGLVSIEVFRVVDGKITEVWNSATSKECGVDRSHARRIGLLPAGRRGR